MSVRGAAAEHAEGLGLPHSVVQGLERLALTRQACISEIMHARIAVGVRASQDC